MARFGIYGWNFHSSANTLIESGFFERSLISLFRSLRNNSTARFFCGIPANLGQKVVGQIEMSGLLQTGGGKKCPRLHRMQRHGKYLPDGGINVPRRFILAADFILGDGGADGLEKSNVIADLNRLGVRNRQRKRLGKLGDGAQNMFVCRRAFGLGPLRVK